MSALGDLMSDSSSELSSMIGACRFAGGDGIVGVVLGRLAGGRKTVPAGARRDTGFMGGAGSDL